jgi:hypothetical protein
MHVVLLVAVAVAATFVPASIAGAAATAKTSTESYVQLNAFWHQRRPAPGDLYRRITWYAGAFRKGDFLYSDLYRYVELCRRAPGQDRCDRTSVEVGSTTDPNVVHLDVSTNDMSGGTLSGTYALREPGGSGPGRVVSVRVRLRGVGEVKHERRRHDRWNGDCLRSRKITVEDRRLGVARGWLTGDVVRNLHTTGDANIESETTTTSRSAC